MLKAMSGDEEGRETIKRNEEEINEQMARDIERRLRNEEAKADKEKEQKEAPQGGGPTTKRGS